MVIKFSQPFVKINRRLYNLSKCFIYTIEACGFFAYIWHLIDNGPALARYRMSVVISPILNLRLVQLIVLIVIRISLLAGERMAVV